MVLVVFGCCGFDLWFPCCVFLAGAVPSRCGRRMVLVWVVDVQLLLPVSAASLRSVVLVA